MNKSMAAVFISATLAVSSLAGAHTEAYFDSITAPHGGQMRMAGPYHLELVTQENEIVLHVTDHADRKISTSGGVGKAAFQVGKAKPKTSIKLEPGEDNTLKGAGAFSVTPETVIIVFIKLPDQEAQSARFTPLKPKPKAQSKKPAKKTETGGESAGEHGGHHHHDH